MKMTGVYYINSSGSKWVVRPNEPFRLEVYNNHGKLIDSKLRKSDYYESFGNFVSYNFRYKGKRYSRLPNDFTNDQEEVVVRLITGV